MGRGDEGPAALGRHLGEGNLVGAEVEVLGVPPRPEGRGLVEGRRPARVAPAPLLHLRPIRDTTSDASGMRWSRPARTVFTLTTSIVFKRRESARIAHRGEDLLHAVLLRDVDFAQALQRAVPFCWNSLMWAIWPM